MKSTCIITLSKTDPFLKELGIDNVIYCEEIPLTPQQKRKVTMKRKKERKERIKRGIEYREKAFKLQDTGNFKEAIEYFKKALEIFPVDSIRYGWTVDNLRTAERLLQEKDTIDDFYVLLDNKARSNISAVKAEILKNRQK